ncbi:MFS transporter [Kineosporia babensis]|uniref:MFS transporter n=1 Tax=Kineosporia babensis TaxID=499548 RepID=A0A9X1NN98_9ACTN|nr:MFS transporter [Kineosporia babensis]MCD5316266.1 MFS transporter [Kineosporia babensis]
MPRPRGIPVHLMNSINLTLRTPLYRGAVLALLLSGIGFSAATPFISLFLVEELNASLRTAGLFALTNVTAPIAGYLVGVRSDRSGDRLGLFRICALVGFLGWASIAISTQLWVPVVISTLVLAFAGAATAQLFAAIHDEPAPGVDGVVAVARMALVGGWVIGPVLGSLLTAVTSLRFMFFATALCLLAQMLPLGRLRTRARSSEHEHDRRAPGLREMRPLLVFTFLTVLLYACDTVKFAYLPIHLDRDLGLPSGVSGAIIGTQPAFELLFIPLAMALAHRAGARWLLVLGGVLAIAGNVCFAFSTTAVGLFAGQALIGGLWGIFGGLGILVAQRLLPSAVATASAVFMSAEPLSAAVGGLAGGLTVEPLGIPQIFLVPAALSVVATIGLLMMGPRPALGPLRSAAADHRA